MGATQSAALLQQSTDKIKLFTGVLSKARQGLAKRLKKKGKKVEGRLTGKAINKAHGYYTPSFTALLRPQKTIQYHDC